MGVACSRQRTAFARSKYLDGYQKHACSIDNEKASLGTVVPAMGQLSNFTLLCPVRFDINNWQTDKLCLWIMLQKNFTV